MAVGDLAYPDGTKENFGCYDKTWGRVKTRTRPAVGNHEFHSRDATYYFDYFGQAAGDAKDGFYSYDLGVWHIIALNSECIEVGGCDAGSREEKWLRSDLAGSRHERSPRRPARPEIYGKCCAKACERRHSGGARGGA